MADCTRRFCDEPEENISGINPRLRRNSSMRFVLLLIFLAGNFVAQAESSLIGLEKITLFGKEYIRATEWAKANKIHLQWVVNERQLRATNSAVRLLFEMDSRRVQFNGVNLTLSFPVIFQKKTVFISSVDLKATLEPLLFPAKEPEGSRIKIICLDSGHGGKDPGKLDGKMEEKKFTLLLTEQVEKLLTHAGFKVVQTRTRDYTLELTDRSRIATRNNADLFVSLHYNAAPTKSVEGTEVYCLTPEGASSSNGGKSAAAYPGHKQNAKSVLLAYEMQKSLVKNLKVEDRGVKRSQFLVLLDQKCPAILIEAGFMTNPSESKRIYDPAYRKRMALAIVDGILAYKKEVER